VILTFLIILYVTNGAKSTYNSPFYTRTVEAIKNRQDAATRDSVIEEERQRHERVERLQKEHDVAVSAVSSEESGVLSEAAKAAGAGKGADKQKPLVDDVKEGVSAVAEAAKEAESAIVERVKPVAGRKTMKDDRVVETKPLKDGDDGVAKVGNVEPKASSALAPDQPGAETAEDHAVELELNDILKRGPIIIFSKSYCPYSKKAKHILLDSYSITPAPYVVELDLHELGPGLQGALQKSTGRRTVPNVLINGKSIGGGDDIEALHRDGKLVDTVTSMGGKRIMSITPSDDGEAAAAKLGLKFRA